MMPTPPAEGVEWPDPPPSGREAVLEYLLDHQAVDGAGLLRARLVAARTRQPVEQTLNQMGILSDEALVAAYAVVTGRPIWDPGELSAGAIGDYALSAEYLRRNRLIPLCTSENRLLVAMCDPLDEDVVGALAFAMGLEVDVWIAAPADWRRAFAEHFDQSSSADSPDERRLERELQIVADAGADSESARLLGSTLERAVSRGASDVHFEPRRHDLRIRLRLDGRLLDDEIAALDLAASTISRIKVLANLDVGERRLPQDGRATFVVEGRSVEVRVSVIPSAFGETAVLRILDRAGLKFDLDSLGFSGRDARALGDIIHAPHGIFLVTGPTGSGKTTTLYALLNSLTASQKKILSIEDPIEYHFAHVTQTQAAPQIGLTFSSALRAFLRQDPDVIMVGEIRDGDTAAVAVQAAMTGHLVLASIHANDALRVIPRLLDMGVAPYQLAAGFLGAAAQRLIRKLCPKCRRERDLTPAETLFLSAVDFRTVARRCFEAVGCDVCAGSGFRGRLAIVECFLCDEEVSAAIARGETWAQMSSFMADKGFIPMTHDGCTKAFAGLTTLAEVMAAVGG